MMKSDSDMKAMDTPSDELQVLGRLPLKLSIDVPAEVSDAMWELYGCLTVHLVFIVRHEPLDEVLMQTTLGIGLQLQEDFLNSEARVTLSDLGPERLGDLLAPYRASLERLREFPVEPHQRSEAARQLIASGLSLLSELLLSDDR